MTIRMPWIIQCLIITQLFICRNILQSHISPSWFVVNSIHNFTFSLKIVSHWLIKNIHCFFFSNQISKTASKSHSNPTGKSKNPNPSHSCPYANRNWRIWNIPTSRHNISHSLTCGRTRKIPGNFSEKLWHTFYGPQNSREQKNRVKTTNCTLHGSSLLGKERWE